MASEIRHGFLSVFALMVSVLERPLEWMVIAYEKAMYGPLHVLLSPLVAKIPRRVVFFGHKVDIFTANNVTFGRTLLFLPIGLSLKYDCNITACVLVVFHDFLDHLDGIVAKTQRRVYGPVDDPVLGGYLDAVCDKVVFLLVALSIVLLCPLHDMNSQQLFIFSTTFTISAGYEVALGIVRTGDYFHVKYTQHSDAGPTGSGVSVAAVMSGKLKEKLLATSQSLLCLAMAYGNPMNSWLGVVAIATLVLSSWFAHKSLVFKLEARKKRDHPPSSRDTQGSRCRCDNSTTNQLTNTPGSIVRSSSEPSMSPPKGVEPMGAGLHGKADKVYTVGCFDLLHQGHRNLFRRMRQLGKELIVGVHTDESIIKLKNRTPIDNTEKRMENVKQYVDQVFAVSSTDPTPYIKCCVHLDTGQTGLYVRGDDMPQFPGRSLCEELMPVHFVPYTKGVSSTLLRAQLQARQEE